MSYTTSIYLPSVCLDPSGDISVVQYLYFGSVTFHTIILSAHVHTHTTMRIHTHTHTHTHTGAHAHKHPRTRTPREHTHTHEHTPLQMVLFDISVHNIHKSSGATEQTNNNALFRTVSTNFVLYTSIHT